MFHCLYKLKIFRIYHNNTVTIISVCFQIDRTPSATCRETMQSTTLMLRTLRNGSVDVINCREADISFPVRVSWDISARYKEIYYLAEVLAQNFPNTVRVLSLVIPGFRQLIPYVHQLLNINNIRISKQNLPVKIMAFSLVSLNKQTLNIPMNTKRSTP